MWASINTNLHVRGVVMDINEARKIAGLPPIITEEVEFSGNETIADLERQLEAARKALGYANQLKDVASKKKWLSKTFINLNKIRAALGRMIDSME